MNVRRMPMSNLNDIFFTPAANQELTYDQVLEDVQRYFAENHASTIAEGICFVPVILLLPMVWGMNGILYAQPIADIISVVITLFMAIHLHKEISIAESRTKTIT